MGKRNSDNCTHARTDFQGFCGKCGEQVDIVRKPLDGMGLKKDGRSRGKYSQKIGFGKTMFDELMFDRFQ